MASTAIGTTPLLRNEEKFSQLILSQTLSGFTQYFDANANPAQGFGSFSGEFEGTLMLPNSGHDKED